MRGTRRLAALAWAAVATAACAAAGYRTDCYEVIAGSFDFDSRTGQWSFQAFSQQLGKPVVHCRRRSGNL